MPLSDSLLFSSFRRCLPQTARQLRFHTSIACHTVIIWIHQSSSLICLHILVCSCCPVCSVSLQAVFQDQNHSLDLPSPSLLQRNPTESASSSTWYHLKCSAEAGRSWSSLWLHTNYTTVSKWMCRWLVDVKSLHVAPLKDEAKLLASLLTVLESQSRAPAQPHPDKHRRTS